MKELQIALLFMLSTVGLTGCLNEKITIAAFNLSFDRATFEQLQNEMATSRSDQDALVEAYLEDKEAMSDDDKVKAEKVIQIRNVAAIIQQNRPDILMMGEFNNEGYGQDLSALHGFQNNYLSIGQSLNSIDGGDVLKPISYPIIESFSTNTGLNSGLDLDNNGNAGQLPGDAWGFGFYHGQYAFAVMSKFGIKKNKVRTFQAFKWKDLPTSSIPTITNCDDENNPIPEGLACGDNWYTDAEWEQVRLSSKNHVDLPIVIPTPYGKEVVHLLLSHPTPPVFDTVTQNNKLRNRDEIQFWIDYINGEKFIYDDSGKKGGLKKNAHFVVMGDLNADPEAGDGVRETIAGLLEHPRVNQSATVGEFVPTSAGALEEAVDAAFPERVTSTFGLRVDYAFPSSMLKVEDSGIYWPASDEPGRLLMNDDRVGRFGNGKDISSDHRMVWYTLDIY
ncbi:endonuclease/exonuclease/phosphatase family protein [Grimontia sp. S25]|uniref:Endonuclease/exonuclease/phosphatase family protein n=1 Tax=Grimontia sedimenti TaxID=2711294 RepID=A0A6M1RGN9_9GAMM|nr:endonuclease/exonuclease/phosphatase family protein [Grimontia sedimenti]NGN96758.1 endonuclease/exonuclease/phosphatase family protein [Grimontia sedimenti]